MDIRVLDFILAMLNECPTLYTAGQFLSNAKNDTTSAYAKSHELTPVATKISAS